MGICVISVLLLGAGSSNAVGIGPLSVLTDRVMRALREGGFGNIVDHIYDVLLRKNYGNGYYQEDEIDMEIILSIINRGVSHDESLKELGPYAVYSSSENADPELNIINRADLNCIRRIVSN